MHLLVGIKSAILSCKKKELHSCATEARGVLRAETTCYPSQTQRGHHQEEGQSGGTLAPALCTQGASN